MALLLNRSVHSLNAHWFETVYPLVEGLKSTAGALRALYLLSKENRQWLETQTSIFGTHRLERRREFASYVLRAVDIAPCPGIIPLVLTCLEEFILPEQLDSLRNAHEHFLAHFASRSNNIMSYNAWEAFADLAILNGMPSAAMLQIRRTNIRDDDKLITLAHGISLELAFTDSKSTKDHMAKLAFSPIFRLANGKAIWTESGSSAMIINEVSNSNFFTNEDIIVFQTLMKMLSSSAAEELSNGAVESNHHMHLTDDFKNFRFKDIIKWWREVGSILAAFDPFLGMVNPSVLQGVITERLVYRLLNFCNSMSLQVISNWLELPLEELENELITPVKLERHHMLYDDVDKLFEKQLSSKLKSCVDEAIHKAVTLNTKLQRRRKKRVQ